jgi:hypothetical protein
MNSLRTTHQKKLLRKILEVFRRDSKTSRALMNTVISFRNYVSNSVEKNNTLVDNK